MDARPNVDTVRLERVRFWVNWTTTNGPAGCLGSCRLGKLHSSVRFAAEREILTIAAIAPSGDPLADSSVQRFALGSPKARRQSLQP